MIDVVFIFISGFSFRHYLEYFLQIVNRLDNCPKSAIGFGWVSSLRFVAAKKTFQQVHRLLPAAI